MTLARRAIWTAFAVAAAAVVYLSLKPGPSGTAFLWWDKAQHFTAYATLAFLAGLGASGLPRAALYAVLLALAGYGMELLQLQVGRSYDLYDKAANALGCLAGFAASALVRRIARHV